MNIHPCWILSWSLTGLILALIHCGPIFGFIGWLMFALTSGLYWHAVRRIERLEASRLKHIDFLNGHYAHRAAIDAPPLAGEMPRRKS
jgi:hypothetical protein